MIETRVIDLFREYDTGIKEGARLLKLGEAVAFPTETVYGIGADALNPNAVQKIFEAKRRPADNPLIVHICDMGMLEDITRYCSEVALGLMREFWPGPLTVVLPRSKNMPDTVTAGLDTVAVRMPNKASALDLIRLSGVPVAAPSANLSHKPSPTRAQHVLADMQGRIPLILDGGPCEVGVESTVVDMTGDVPELLRPGGVPLEALRRVLGEVRSTAKETDAPKSPGMKYKHYSPRAAVVVVRGTKSKEKICEMYDGFSRTESCAILAKEASSEYGKRRVVALGPGERDAARNFFDALRKLDSEGVERIFIEAMDESGLGRAVMDRAVRAAGFNVIQA